jgi:glycosyltransferase involved in cell wall biosynthesis
MMAECLTDKGLEVFVVSWQAPRQEKRQNIRGITVLSFPYKPSNSLTYLPLHFTSYLQSLLLYKTVDADIYQSIELQLSTYIAEKAMPDRKHIVWFQDPYDEKAYQEMSLVDKEYSWNAEMKARFYSTLPILRKACHGADRLFTQALCFLPMINRLYRPRKKVLPLLNPVDIPKTMKKKASEPTVCFLGRWDPQKRVEKFLQLAQRFPGVNFVAMGKSHNRLEDARLRRKYRGVRNLQMPGLVSEEEKRDLLARSWVLVNTSVHEGLPIAFLEALAHRTALLSCVDPDGYVSRFGYHTNCDGLDCFENGLRTLLDGDLWREKAEAGFAYVEKNHAVSKIIDEWVEIYKGLL